MNLARLRNYARQFTSYFGADFRGSFKGWGEVGSVAVHLRAAADWLCRAQDAGPDDGVSRSYEIIFNRYFGSYGWLASYPETTGYIIPTLLQYATLSGIGDMRDRAIRMAKWESQVQLESGAVQGGIIGEGRSPAIFNSGQVLFGWLRAHEETNDALFERSAKKAARFLVGCQDADGCWRRGLSRFSSDAGLDYRIYNVRAAWGLLETGRRFGSERFLDAALENADFTMTHQRPNGWFDANCLSDPDFPLLHTIAYTARGLLEIGVSAGRDDLVGAAERVADAIRSTRRTSDAGFSGRFDSSWKPSVSWSCVTGEAQMAVVWAKLGHLLGRDELFDEMRVTNRRLMKAQYAPDASLGLAGGLPGSLPVQGEYGRYEVLNWGVKFHMDALMCEHYIDSGEPEVLRRIW